MTAIVLYLQHTPNARTRRSGSLSCVPFGLADVSAMEERLLRGSVQAATLLGVLHTLCRRRRRPVVTGRRLYWQLFRITNGFTMTPIAL